MGPRYINEPTTQPTHDTTGTSYICEPRVSDLMIELDPGISVNHHSVIGWNNGTHIHHWTRDLANRWNNATQVYQWIPDSANSWNDQWIDDSANKWNNVEPGIHRLAQDWAKWWNNGPGHASQRKLSHLLKPLEPRMIHQRIHDSADSWKNGTQALSANQNSATSLNSGTHENTSERKTQPDDENKEARIYHAFMN